MTSRNLAFAKDNAVTGSLKDSVSLLMVYKRILQSKIDSLPVKKDGYYQNSC